MEATLRYADFLFGKYENSADVPPEKTDTIDHSSAVNELLEAIGTLRRSNEEVRDEAAQAVKDAFGEAWYLQPSDG